MCTLAGGGGGAGNMANQLHIFLRAKPSCKPNTNLRFPQIVETLGGKWDYRQASAFPTFIV